jgi:hypothetical protein
MKLELDAVAAKNWIYPVDVPKRDYQFNIIKHALFENCLVALPTGTGKTFIAAVIMRNCENYLAFNELGQDTSSRLQLVPQRQSRLRSPNKTIGQSATGCLPQHMRDPSRRMCHHDRR